MRAEEFDGLRATLYEQALSKFPNARKQDIQTMYKLLNPQEREAILGVGEGNGFFVSAIASAVGSKGRFLVTDPSKDQLIHLNKNTTHSQVRTKQVPAQKISEKNIFDKAWSFGAFHHCKEQEKAMSRIYASLKPNGIFVLCDVFQGSKLAEHFDGPVSSYCITGHDVNFLSETYAKTIAKKAGFQSVQLVDLDQKWIFDKKEHIGEFIFMQ